MRKLLIASQKGGVGKTTTSINLAAAAAQAGARVLLLDADPLSCISSALNLHLHARRQVLRQLGMELPGVLVSSLIPGLDVLCPYEEGICTDQDLDELFKVLASAEFSERYTCLIVGTPPFLGPNAAQLLATCDEFIIAIRAEAMAYRTLPAFFELVQKNKNSVHPIQLRGLLLTLPQRDDQGERWERELRGRFGGRVLPAIIPFDEAISKAVDAGEIAVQVAPEALASQQYLQLAGVLGLTVEATASDLRNEAPLLEIAAAMQSAGLLTRERATLAVIGGTETITEVAAATLAPPPPPPRVSPTYKPLAKSKPAAPIMPSQALRNKPLATPKRLDKPPVAPPAPKKPEAREAPKQTMATSLERPGGQPWMIWLGLIAATLIGVGVRFVPKMPDFMMPLVIGALVTAGVILTLKLLMKVEDASTSSAEVPARDKTITTKPPSRPDLKKDSRSRMAALARQSREQRLKRNRDAR